MRFDPIDERIRAGGGRRRQHGPNHHADGPGLPAGRFFCPPMLNLTRSVRTTFTRGEVIIGTEVSYEPDK